MARSFNGSTDHIDTGSYAIPAAVTLSCWVKPNSPSNAYNGLVSQSGGVAALGDCQILQKSTGKVAWYVATNPASPNFVAIDPGLATLSNGVWVNLVLIYDSVVGLKTFVNGVSDGTQPAVSTLVSTSQPFTVGYDAATPIRNFPGSIAHAAQWNIALSNAEAVALANGALPSTIRPLSLLTYLPLDGLQSPEPDFSGLINNGTLTGTALDTGPPVMQFTPRWQQFNEFVAAAGGGVKWEIFMRHSLLPMMLAANPSLTRRQAMAALGLA